MSTIWDKILKFLRLREHDVEDIVSNFTKTAKRLADKADALYLEHAEHETEAALLRLKSIDKKAASEKAGEIARKISALVNG